MAKHCWNFGHCLLICWLIISHSSESVLWLARWYPSLWLAGNWSETKWKWYVYVCMKKHFLSISNVACNFLWLPMEMCIAVMLRHLELMVKGDLWISPGMLRNWISAFTETDMLSFWRNLHHWLHKKLLKWQLSKWQLQVQPVMKILLKWLFHFSVGSNNDMHKTRYCINQWWPKSLMYIHDICVIRPQWVNHTFLFSCWGGWGCEVSCGGYHQLRGKTTMGSALDGVLSVWHRSNTGLSSTQYEQIPVILGVWPFWLTPFFFRSITFWLAYG